MQRRAHCDALHRIDAALGLAADDFLEPLANNRHTRWPAHQQHAIDVARLQLGVLERLLDRLVALGEHRLDKFLQLGAGHVDLEVLGAS